MSRSLGLGIVGCGEVAVATAQAITAASNAHVAATLDVDASRAAELGERHGATPVSGWSELLELPSVEAIYIATPHALHGSQAIDAMDHGKHVLVEKPIACTLEDADLMIDAARRNGRALSVAFPMRYDPAVDAVRALIASGTLGRLVGFRLACMMDKPHTYWDGGYSHRAPSRWRARRDEAGGGVLIMNAVHSIDRLTHVTGLCPRRVHAEMGTYASDVEVEDLAFVTVRMHDDTIGTIEASSFSYGRGEMTDHLYLTQGHVVWGQQPHIFLAGEPQGLPACRLHTTLTGRAPKGPWGRRGLIEGFAAAVLEARPPPISAEAGRDALALVLAAYASSERGAPVEIARLTDRTHPADPPPTLPEEQQR